MNEADSTVVVRHFADDGRFPNNGELPLVIITAVFEPEAASAEKFERLFTQNGWPAAWRNGLYDFHHYHSTAHEVLGVYRGWVDCRFGGPDGETIRAAAGDIIIIPAGVSHRNVGQSPDFSVVGAYPADQQWDLKCGEAGERPSVDDNISLVPRPSSDPAYGRTGPLLRFWS